MNITCPKCGTVYKVTAAHVGVRIVCKRCGTALQVQGEVPPELPAAEEASPGEELSPPPRYRPVPFRSPLGGIQDIPTWLFGAGAILVIFFLFLPLIDKAKIGSREASIAAGELREKRLDRALAEKKDRTSADEEIRRKGRESWKTERETLADALDDAKSSGEHSLYWYRYGMLFGFLLLAIASLLYLSPEQPAIRRVVGAVVILAEVVLIFVVFLLSAAARL